jgi:hypothetical protein
VRPLRLVALAAGIGLLGHLGRLSLAFGNHHESVEVRDEDVYLRVPVISKDEEVARVSADPLVLVPRHLEEDGAIPLAAFAHDVHVCVLWARLVGHLDRFVELPVGSLVLGNTFRSWVHRDG